jgi:flagellar hook-associated protein 3 FlgL
MTNNVLVGIFRESEKLLRAQEMVTTQKRINRPSDDPVGSGRVLQYRQVLASIDQYRRNGQIADNRIQLLETTLGAIQDQVSVARKLADENASNSGNADARMVAAVQVEQIRSQVLQLANTRSGGHYIFSGRSIDTAPFDLQADDSVLYAGDDSPEADLRLLAGENVEVRIPANGNEIITEDLFDALLDLQTELEQTTPDTAVLTAQAVRLQDALSRLSATRAEASAIYDRVKLNLKQFDKLEQSFGEMLSGTEDVDMARSVVELKAQETAYEATIATAARLIQPSLINFLS